MWSEDKETAGPNETIELDKKVVNPLEEEQEPKRVANQDDELNLPENFKVARAIGGGDCFFDSVARSLKQIRVDEEISIKQLRELCHVYAVENQWVKPAVVKDARTRSYIFSFEDNQIWNAYLLGIRFTAYDMEKMKRIDKVLYSTLTTSDYGETLLAPIRGRPEIEGRIICEKYNVKLHIVEKHNVNGKNQIVDMWGSKSVDSVDYNDINTIHILNESKGNFKPILNIQTIQRKPWEGTTGGLDGHLYKIFLLILGRFRGQRYTDKFYLTANVGGVGAFDDVVFRYWHEEKSTLILLQSIHLENPINSKLTYDHFTNQNSDNIFYLGKYFADYLISRKKLKERFDDPIFQGDFQVKYIIYTNAILDENFYKIDIDNTNSIFCTKSKENKKKAFKFSLHNSLITMLEKVSCQERIKSLANALVNCISGKLNYNNIMGNELLSTYQVFLAKNVIDVGKEIKIDEALIEYREGKFKHNFFHIDKNNQLEKDLKKEILYEFAKNVMFNQKSSSGLDNNDKRNDLVNKVANLATVCGKNEMEVEVDEEIIQILGGNAIILDTKERTLKFADEEKMEDESAKQFIRDLKSKVNNILDYKFKITYELVKKTLEEQLEKEPLKLHVSFGNINPSFTEQKHSIEQLIKLFDNSKSRKFFKIVDNEIGHGKVLTDEDIRNIGKLVGNLLVFDQKDKMLRLASEDSLDENGLKLIKELRTAAVQRDLHFDTRKYRFDIRVKKFPTDLLGVNAKDRTNVKEFLNELEVFTDQASDQEFRTIIKNEIRNLYKLTEDEVEDNFHNLKEKGEEYWKRKKNKYYLEKNDDFYQGTLMFHTVFNVRKPMESFTGRVKQLEKLHIVLQGRSDTATSQIASISGHGGIGKTELARKYAFDCRNYYNGNVIWINIESYQSLVESFTRLAQDNLGISVKEKNIKCIVNEVYDFYSNRKCLFIFEIAEKFIPLVDGDEGIKLFLPSLPSIANKAYILITSRHQIWGNMEKIPLDTFTEKEATDFIIKELQIDDESQKNDIQRLVEILQQFPLALMQAVAYIKHVDKEVKYVEPERGFKIDDYLKEYEKKKILDFPFPYVSNDKYNRIMLTTFQVSIDKIKKEEYGKKALEILEILAYCAPDNIPPEIFLNLGQDNCDAKREFRAAVQLLKQYCMVNLDDGIISVHRLVQEVTRINLMDEKREEEILRKALELIKCYDSKNRFEFSPSCVMWKHNTTINGETFGIWWKHNTSSRPIFTKEKRILTNAGKSNDIERHASYIWCYASEYVELIEDFYSAYGEKRNTPIHLFAINGKIKAIESLLKKLQGKLMDKLIEFNKIGYAPIHSAAFNGHKEIVEYLIEEQGVDINFLTDNGEHTPLDVAIFGNQLHILQYLLRIKGVNPNIRRKKGLPIHYAAQNARMDLIECFVNNNAKIYITDELSGNNVLHYALRHLKICNTHLSDVEEIFKYFLEKKSVLGSSANMSGITPLHLAAELGYTRIVKILLDYGANVNSRSYFYEPTINIINIASSSHAKRDFDSCIKRHMDNMIKPLNKSDDNYIEGYTPLHIAAKENHLDIVKLLLQKGAIYEVANDFRITPKDIAKFDSEVGNLLVSIDRSFKAVVSDKKDELDRLLKGKDSDALKSILNARDRKRNTLLQAATNEQIDIINLLLEKLTLCSVSNEQQETK